MGAAVADVFTRFAAAARQVLADLQADGEIKAVGNIQRAGKIGHAKAIVWNQEGRLIDISPVVALHVGGALLAKDAEPRAVPTADIDDGIARNELANQGHDHLRRGKSFPIDFVEEGVVIRGGRVVREARPRLGSNRGHDVSRPW